MSSFRRALDARSWPCRPASGWISAAKKRALRIHGQPAVGLRDLSGAMAAVVILSLNSFRQAAIIGLVGLSEFRPGAVRRSSVRLAVRLSGADRCARHGRPGHQRCDHRAVGAESGSAGPQWRHRRRREVVVDATRHIVSTTATTIGGFLPLILFGGTFWPPLATAIAGGRGRFRSHRAVHGAGNLSSPGPQTFKAKPRWSR